MNPDLLRHRPVRRRMFTVLIALVALVGSLLAGLLLAKPALAAPPTLIKIDAGGFHTCALTSMRGVKCWGQNGAGQLGDSTSTNRSMPVDVSGLASGIQLITAGGIHTCALTNVGSAKCWGYNSNGQLGDTTTTNRSTPESVVFLEAPLFTSSAPAGGSYGTTYSHSFAASGAPPPSFSVTSSSMPYDLALSTTSGMLSGTPTAAGSYAFTITASNGQNPAATQSVTLVIAQVPLAVSTDAQSRTMARPTPRSRSRPAASKAATLPARSPARLPPRPAVPWATTRSPRARSPTPIMPSPSRPAP